MKKSLKKAFTLVELIVVIAIVAVLSTVAVVGYNTFIDQANLSADEQELASMNTALSAFTTVSSEAFDSDDIKYFINSSNGGGRFDFTPRSKGYAYFYISSTKKIELLKYDEVRSKYPNNYADIDTPEEFYGKGIHLLTEYGHHVADMISRIRDLGNSDNLMTSWNAIMNDYKNYEDVAPGRIESFIYEFGPAFNIYVSNEGWKSSGSIQYERIIFARYQMHIPEIKNIDLPLSQINVKLPKTVKSVEANSFSFFGSKLSMKIHKGLLYAEDTFVMNEMQKQNIPVNPIPLLNVGFAEGSYDPLTKTLSFENGEGLVLDLTSLPRSNIYGMHVKAYTLNGETFYTLRAFSRDTIVGQITIKVILPVVPEVE